MLQTERASGSHPSTGTSMLEFCVVSRAWARIYTIYPTLLSPIAWLLLDWGWRMLDYCLTNVWPKPAFFLTVWKPCIPVPSIVSILLWLLLAKVILKSYQSHAIVKIHSHAIVDRFAPDYCMTLHDFCLTDVKFPFLLGTTSHTPPPQPMPSKWLTSPYICLLYRCEYDWHYVSAHISSNKMWMPLAQHMPPPTHFTEWRDSEIRWVLTVFAVLTFLFPQH